VSDVVDLRPFAVFGAKTLWKIDGLKSAKTSWTARAKNSHYSQQQPAVKFFSV